MRRSQHSDDEILTLLDEARRGIPITAICETAHVSLRTFYRWKKRLDGVSPKSLERISKLEAENARLKRQLASLGPSQSARAKALRTRPLSPNLSPRPDFGPTLGDAGPIPPDPRTPGARTGRFAAVRSGR